VFLSFLLLEKV